MVEFRKNEEEVKAWVTDIELPTGQRHTFVRLVPRGNEDVVADSYSIDDCMVDVDGNGDVIGITVPLWGDDLARDDRYVTDES